MMDLCARSPDNGHADGIGYDRSIYISLQLSRSKSVKSYMVLTLFRTCSRTDACEKTRNLQIEELNEIRARLLATFTLSF